LLVPGSCELPILEGVWDAGVNIVGFAWARWLPEIVVNPIVRGSDPRVLLLIPSVALAPCAVVSSVFGA
jgi:hypothetical protein